MRKALKYGIFVAMALLLVSILVLAMTFSLPEMKEFKDVRIKELNGQKVQADFICTVRNDNFYGLRAYDLDYVVSFRDTVIGTGKVEKVHLQANSATELTLPAFIELQGIAAIHKTMLATPQCTLEIFIDGRFSRLRYRHEYVAEAVISPKSLLSSLLDKAFAESGPEFKNIKLESISRSKSKFQATAEFKNPLPISYSVTSMDMKASGKKMRGKVSGEWKLARELKVKPGDLVSIPIALEISNLEAGKDILTKVFNRLQRYYVWGTVQVDLDGMKYEIPVEGVFEFDVLRRKWEFKNP